MATNKKLSTRTKPEASKEIMARIISLNPDAIKERKSIYTASELNSDIENILGINSGWYAENTTTEYRSKNVSDIQLLDSAKNILSTVFAAMQERGFDLDSIKSLDEIRNRNK